MSSEPAENSSIVFIGRGADGAPLTIDILPPERRADAAGAARVFLAEHLSCLSVELWTGDVRLGAMIRDGGEAVLDLTDLGREALG